MEVKIGQWVRTECGAFYKIEQVLNDWVVLSTKSGVKIKDVMIKNTPQELIQANDWIEVTLTTMIDMYGENIIDEYDTKLTYRFEVSKLASSFLYQDLVIFFVSKKWQSSDLEGECNITKIFTPNSKGDFIKQWEVK